MKSHMKVPSLPNSRALYEELGASGRSDVEPIFREQVAPFA